MERVERWQGGFLDQVIHRYIVVEKANIIAVDPHCFFDECIAVEVTLQAAAITAPNIFLWQRLHHSDPFSSQDVWFFDWFIKF